MAKCKSVYLLFLIFLGLICFPVVTSVETSSSIWKKTYGGTQYDDACALIETSDGGFALAGITNSFGAGDYDIWLIKTDSAGNMEWNKTYGGPEYDTTWSLVETSEGGFVLAGITTSFGAGKEDFWLIKTDSAGNMEWNKTYGGPRGDDSRSLIITSDGGFIITGLTYSFGTETGDFWLIKTDSAGNMEWNKTYGGPEYDHPRSLVVTSDGGFVISGCKTSYDTGKSDVWLMKTDSAGNMEWNKTYGGARSEDVFSMKTTSDGGFILTGHTSSFGAGGYDCWVVKTDSAGNMEWNKTYGGASWDQGNSVVMTSDGGFVFAGETSSFGVGYKDFWFFKTDSAGNMEWNKTYGGGLNELLRRMIITSDGGFALAGSTESFGAGESDFWLIKGDKIASIQYEVITHDVVIDQNNYVIETSSNSSLTDLAFNETAISFIVDGTSGTAGYCKITIPQELMSGNFSIYKDGTSLIKNVDYTETYNSTHYIFSLTYEHSTHTIEIIATKVIPEFTSWLILPLSFITVAITMLFRRKLTKNIRIC